MQDDAKIVRWFSEIDWLQAGVRVAGILVLTTILIFVARRLITGFEQITARNADDIDSRRRAATVSLVLRKTVTAILSTLAILAILNAVGITIMPFLATAGVAGIAIAFGAQTLVKDFLKGFFLVAENQIRQGDAVEIAGKAGVVENLTLRYVQLRDYQGNVHFVPNGEIAVVTNSSRTFSYAVMDVMIASDQEIEPVIDAMREIGVQMRAHAEWAGRIHDELELSGIESWNERGITLRARFRVPAVDQGPVRREFLLRLKRVFDEQKIRQPQMQVSLVNGPSVATK
jgi:small conductance mechanosensitive channel